MKCLPKYLEVIDGIVIGPPIKMSGTPFVTNKFAPNGTSSGYEKLIVFSLQIPKVNITLRDGT